MHPNNWAELPLYTVTFFFTQIMFNRRERAKTGGGLLHPDAELSEIDEMFADYVGVEGVVGKLSFHESNTQSCIYIWHSIWQSLLTIVLIFNLYPKGCSIK